MAEDPKRSEASGTNGRSASAPARQEALAIGTLLMLAALFRALRWSAVAVIFNDGPIFISLAQAVAADGPTLVDVIAQPLQDAEAPVSEWIA